MFDLVIISQILWTSLATTSYLTLFAVAFSLVLKVNGIFNFTQAAAMSVAFYTAYTCVQIFKLPGAVAFIAALVMTVALCWIIEITGFTSLRKPKASSLFVFIFTFIISQFASYVISLIFGTWSYTIFPSMFWNVYLFGELAISAWDIPAMASAFCAIMGLFAFLRFTKYGQFMLAVSDKPDLAQFYGIDTRKVFLLTMIIAGALVTLGMFLFGTRSLVQPRTSMELMLFAAVATIIGGIGNIAGAAIAAICLGIIQNASILFISSEWQGFLLYVFLFGTIIFFPEGFKLTKKLKVGSTSTRQLPPTQPAPQAAAERTE
jgi:branched-subunit amino acid ABC-type transport system permease component